MEKPKVEPEKPTPLDAVERAEKAVADMEAQNDRAAEILKQQQELRAEQIVSGRADAGAIPPKPKPLTDIEYAEALERGEVNPLKDDGFI